MKFRLFAKQIVRDALFIHNTVWMREPVVEEVIIVGESDDFFKIRFKTTNMVMWVKKKHEAYEVQEVTLFERDLGSETRFFKLPGDLRNVQVLPEPVE